MNLYIFAVRKMKLFRVISLLFAVGFLFVAAAEAYGQSVTIIVKDEGMLPLPGANIRLTSITDSTLWFRASDLSGTARFDRLTPGDYFLTISYVGFNSIEATIAIGDGHRDIEYIMAEDAITMNEVIIIARRPLMRMEEDKMIIDTETIAAISTNTLEMLESTPGLLVDQDGGIYISSATPATIFINGREQKMSNQDIMTILRSLPPGSVQRIEVIRTPSARYAATSSGGIINVVLKKGVRIGRFGSLRAGMNQGVSGNRFTGFSFNSSGDRSTSYLNFEYSLNGILEELETARSLAPDTSLFQEAETSRRSNQGYLGYGISYDASDKVVLSYDGRINASGPLSEGTNSNLIRTSHGQLLSETLNSVSNRSSFVSFRQEAGALFRPDTLGTELDTRISYTYITNCGNQEYSNRWIMPAATGVTGAGDNLQYRHFIQLQTDLTYQLPLEIKMEAGLNSSWQVYDSRADYTISFGGTNGPDPFRTNSYSYIERINSAYLQASRHMGWKINLKTGLRMEHTYMKGTQTIPSDTSFVTRSANLFPYLYLSRPIGSIMGFEFRTYAIYRRTISRPGYESLNPAIRYVDQFFYETGNPALKPQFNDNIEVNISLDDMPIFAIGRNYTSDIFAGVIYRDPVNENAAFRTFDNLGTNRETYFRIMGGIPPTGRYFFYAGAQYNLNEYEGIYENRELTFSRGSWRLFTYHALRITQTTRLTMSGFLVTRGQMGFYELEDFGQLNFGLNQTFLDRKLSVTLSARDVLRSMVNEFTLNQGSISTTGKRYSDTRRFGISATWNFGIPDRKEKSGKMSFDPDDL